jgi:hypothetical protein
VIEYFRSSAVTCRPLWNLAPSRIVNVYVRPSAETLGIAAASRGTISFFSPQPNQPLIHLLEQVNRRSVLDHGRVERGRLGRENVAQRAGHLAARIRALRPAAAV